MQTNSRVANSAGGESMEREAGQYWVLRAMADWDIETKYALTDRWSGGGEPARVGERIPDNAQLTAMQKLVKGLGPSGIALEDLLEYAASGPGVDTALGVDLMHFAELARAAKGEGA